MDPLWTAFSFLPQGECLRWEAPMLTLQMVSDSIIAFVHILIPLLLIYSLSSRRWIGQFEDASKIVLIFMIFISLDGITRITNITVLWFPLYWLQVMIKIITAIASVGAAAVILPLFPQMLDRYKESTERLVAMEQRFHAISESLLDAVVIADQEGLISFWNKGAENMFGWRLQEVQGQSLTVLMPERYRAAHLLALSKYRITQESKMVSRQLDAMGLKKDGSEFSIRISLSAWRQPDDNRYWFGAFVRHLPSIIEEL